LCKNPEGRETRGYGLGTKKNIILSGDRTSARLLPNERHQTKAKEKNLTGGTSRGANLTKVACENNEREDHEVGERKGGKKTKQQKMPLVHRVSNRSHQRFPYRKNTNKTFLLPRIVEGGMSA